MFHFGVKIQIAFIANYFANNLDKILIGKFLGPAYITVYDIGTKIITFLREIPFVFFLIIMPYSSELFAVKDIDKIKQISLEFTRYFLVFASVVFSFVYFTGESVLRFWIGNTINPQSVYVLHVLLIGSIIHLSTGIMTTILKSAGKIRPEIIGNTVILIVNCILSVTLITFFGLKGVVWGTSLGFITGSIVLFYLSTKALDIPFSYFIVEIFKVPLLNALIMFFVNSSVSQITFRFLICSDFRLFINISIGLISMFLNVLILYKLRYLPILLKKKHI
jgi:O-antigen/teichoic acid export membrane protein